MELQKVFTHSYMEKLRRNIHVSDYQQESFPYDATQVKKLANIYQPQGLLDQMDATDDYKSAVALYKAYSDLTPLVASLPDLWVYLAHVDLFSYVQKRFDINNRGIDEKYIVNHWFKNEVNIFRQGLPGLWWSVYLSCDNERKNPFELTEILFRNQELRTNSFGPLLLIRHKPAMQGILEFFKDHTDLLGDGMNMRAQYIRKLFNNIGGYKPLAFMDKYFFRNELEKRLDIISVKYKREDIQNNKQLFNPQRRTIMEKSVEIAENI